jgi:hypothetical protein
MKNTVKRLVKIIFLNKQALFNENAILNLKHTFLPIAQKVGFFYYYFFFYYLKCTPK